jgi:hypothetical protein
LPRAATNNQEGEREEEGKNYYHSNYKKQTTYTPATNKRMLICKQALGSYRKIGNL